MSTYFARKEDVVDGTIKDAPAGSVMRNWFVVDAEGQTLGRLATRIATVLRGRHKPIYDKIQVTGSKANAKKYYRYSGHPGGLQARTFAEQMSRDPDRIIRQAVRGMLPKNRLARRQITKLKCYSGASHPHSAQQPQPLPQ
jgi:large subunit ribosomal protein L13